MSCNMVGEKRSVPLGKVCALRALLRQSSNSLKAELDGSERVDDSVDVGADAMKLLGELEQLRSSLQALRAALAHLGLKGR